MCTNICNQLTAFYKLPDFCAQLKHNSVIRVELVFEHHCISLIPALQLIYVDIAVFVTQALHEIVAVTHIKYLQSRKGTAHPEASTTMHFPPQNEHRKTPKQT